MVHTKTQSKDKMTIDTMIPDTEEEESTTIPPPTAVTSEDLLPNDETDHVATTPSSRAVSGAPAVTPYPPPQKTISSSSSTEEPCVTAPLLSLYYQHLFPYDFIYQWFRYGTTGTNSSSSMNLFLHREFSFTIQNPQKDEIYLRYQSYASLSDFASAVQKRCPMKIDIGAIFSHPPVQKHTLGGSTTLTPIEREFVLDIDLTDYDDIRNCGCQQAQICPICWKYMSMAMATINVALREDFDFHHLQWFYSGRRGIHGWVCDAAAKTLTDAGRTAVANYLTVRTSCVCVWDSSPTTHRMEFLTNILSFVRLYTIRSIWGRKRIKTCICRIRYIPTFIVLTRF